MYDTQKILFANAAEIGKRADRYLFLLIISIITFLITYLSDSFEADIPFIDINVKQYPNAYYFLTTIVMFVLLGLSGLSIQNYMVTRFSIEKIGIECYEKDSRFLAKELVRQNKYEFIFDYYLGSHFESNNINDLSRKVSLVGMRLVVIASIVVILMSAFLLGNSIGVPGLSFIIPIVFLCLIILFLNSFFETIGRRKKLIPALVEKLIEEQEKELLKNKNGN